MRSLPPLAALAAALLAGPAARAQPAADCRPGGPGVLSCQPRQPGPPEMTPQMAQLIRRLVRSQVPAVPYAMTPDEMTDRERNGGTATDEERAAQPGSQFEACEERLQAMGHAHVVQSSVCAGLSIHAPTPGQLAEFDRARDAEDAARFAAGEDAQRRAGEALRDRIAADRARHRPGRT